MCVEDEGGVYIEMVDEEGVPTLVLDTETDRQLMTDYITEQDTEKYFVQQEEQEDEGEMETISSTSMADYNRDEVEASLTTITDAFHKMRNEYEHLCSIVPHMAKTQAANVIGRLPIVPFMGKGMPVKTEAKTEPGKSEPTTTMTTMMTAMTQETATRVTDMAGQERTTGVQVTPGTLPVVEIDTNLEEEIDIEKDTETSKRVTETTGETGIKPEKVEQYNRYVLSGKGGTPEQKVNEVLKDINYHNMVVVIAVGDRTINNVGSIHTVAEKWGLSFSVVQQALSCIKEHRQGGQQYDKLAGRPQRRSRKRDEDESKMRDKSDEEIPPPKKLKTGKGK